MMDQPKKGAVIYLRCSPRPKKGNGEDDNDSIAVQESVCRDYCKSKGYYVKETCIDEQISGTQIWEADRPGIWQAIHAVKPGDIVVVQRWDRLARSVAAFEMLKREFDKKKVRIESTCQAGSLDTPDEAFIRTIFIAVAQYERDMTSIRTKHAANVYQYQQGRVMGRRDRIPYGYQIDMENVSDTGKNLMIENPNEMDVVQLIVNLRDWNELSYIKIAQQLNSSGSSKRNGRPWDAATVRIIYRRAKGVK